MPSFFVSRPVQAADTFCAAPKTGEYPYTFHKDSFPEKDVVGEGGLIPLYKNINGHLYKNFCPSQIILEFFFKNRYKA